MVIIRENESADKILNWKSGNGIWEIKAKRDQWNCGTRRVQINLYRKGQRVHLGVGKTLNSVPAYVIYQYNMLHDEIRGRGDGKRK